MNMALDEAIAKAVGAGKVPPTIRFYTWNPPAVSIGYFQEVEVEVNIDYCRSRGIDIVRRITGGGAVYHGPGELTYCIAVPQDYSLIPSDIVESYKVLCQGIICGLKRLGIEARFRPINDIEIKGRKVSGSAQTRRFGAVLQHGTLLIDVDVDVMFNALKIAEEKMRDKAIKEFKKRVTSLKEETGRSLSHFEVAEVLKEGFEESLGIELIEKTLSEDEVKDALKLRNEKYATREWNFMR